VVAHSPVNPIRTDLANASTFRKNFLAVAKANVIAQILLLAFMPLITRLYGPEAFGLAAYFIAALQLVSAFSSWKYEKLVPNSRSHRSAAARVLVGISVLGLACLTIILAMATLPVEQFPWAGAAELGPLLWWLPLAVAALGLHHLGASWFVLEKELSLVSRARIMQSIGYLIAALACAALSFTRSGLVVAVVASWTASALVLTGGLGPLKAAARKLSADKVQRIAALTYAEASRTAGVGFVNTVSSIAPVLLLAQVYSVAEVGIYSLMMRMIGTPLTVVTSSLALSFWSRAAELAREKRYAVLRATFLKTTAYLGVPALGVLAICLFGPPYVPLVLGQEWAHAGPVLTALAPLLIGSVMFSAPSHLIVLRRQGFQVIADGLRLVLMVLVVIASHRFQLPFELAVLGVALSSLAGHLTLFAIQLLLHRRLRLSQSTSVLG